ncbi:NAD(P)-binding protein [Aspergillus ambiguus]|uniref:NAD(P)-binding protein n=1 Tax=Aspergillus ambiguus TaxID=176160 RepID=UPI003CCCBB12
MASQGIVKIFVVGGTGAQGTSVISGLVRDKKYQVRALTRNSTSPRARQLESLGSVEFIEGSFASESDLRKGYRGCDGAFINIDGFNCGEKTETYWAIRAYELAIEEGIKFFVYGNLDYGYKKGGYDPKYRCGHYDGKGRIAEWVLFQNQFNQGRMRAAVFTSGPYIEMTIAIGTPMSPTVEDGIVTWRVPLGSGAIPHVSLDDCGHYVRWMFDNPDRANGLDLEVAIEHVHYEDLARAFEAVTGHPARFIDESLDSYWARGPLSMAAELGGGYNSDPSDPAFMTVRENFTGFWNLWKDSGKNQGIITRDYKLLDEIHPNRIRTVEQWFRVESERGLKDGRGTLWERMQPGNMRPILKIAEDGMKGSL